MDKNFINGMILKAKTITNADGTTWGKLGMSIKVDEFIKQLQEIEVNGWVNIDIMKSQKVSDKGVTHYAVENSWAKDKALKEGEPSQVAIDNPQIGEVPDTSDILF